MRFRSTLSVKFFFAFVSIALLSAPAGIIGLVYINRLASQTELLSNRTTRPLTLVFSLHGDVITVSQAVRELGSIYDVINNSSLVDRKTVRIDEALSELRSTGHSATLSRDLEAFAATWEKYKVGLSKLVQSAAARDEAGASAALTALPEAELSRLILAVLISFADEGTALTAASRMTATRALRVVAGFSAIALLAAALFAIVMGRRLTKPITTAVQAASRIAAGELVASIDERLLKRADEFGELSRALSCMTTELASRMRVIQSSVDELSAVGIGLEEHMRDTDNAVLEVSTVGEKVRLQAETQSAGVVETAATVRNMAATIELLDGEIYRQTENVMSSSSSIEQLLANIASIGEVSTRMGSNFAELLKASEEGRDMQDQVGLAVIEIAKRSERLNEANDVVASIADQTNLLAMNAAIEAAHAGDAGVGFAVVAEEIRSLAESVALQSSSIQEDISLVRSSIEEAEKSTKLTREAFSLVANLLRGVEALEQEIRSSLGEGREGSRQALGGLEKINEASDHVRLRSSELLEGSKAIGVETVELEASTAALRLAVSEIVRTVGAMEKASRSVAQLSERNGRAIAEVAGLVRSYRLEEDVGSEACVS